MRLIAIVGLVGALFLLLAGCSGSSQQEFRATPQTALPVQKNEPSRPVSPELSAKLLAELRRVLAQRGITLDAHGKPVGKAVSALPARDYITPVQVGDPFGGTDLSWFYNQRGDYDLNGEVNASDLTPIGIYFGAKTGDANWNQAQVADGDHNGEVNIADVSPIGQNFGIQTAGYVVEAQDYGGSPWREYGFAPFAAASKATWYVSFSYNAPGGADLADFRVAPVGPERLFTWDTYQLTSGSNDETAPTLAVVGGRLVLSHTWLEGLGTPHAGFAVANSPRPSSAADWNFDGDLGFDLSHVYPIPIIDIQGTPVIAYCRSYPAKSTYGISIAYRNNDTAPSSTWSTFEVTVAASEPEPPELIDRQGKPTVLYGVYGLNMVQGLKAFPTSSLDWLWISGNPSLNNFEQMDAVASGGWIFSAGYNTQTTPYLLFNRTNNANPSGTSDFTEYHLQDVGATDGYPSIAMVNGVACVAVADYTKDALGFFNSQQRLASAAGDWFLHYLPSGTNGDFKYPSMCLVDGRPAITSGYGTLDFHWTAKQFPEYAEDWQTQRIDDGVGPYGSSMVMAGGLPVVAYTKQVGGATQIMIAVAREQ